MKEKKKTIIIAAGVFVAVIIVLAVVVIMNFNKSYRTIAVQELTGTTKIRDKKDNETDAYIGQHLVSGDDANVKEASDLTLLLDQDKYVFAEALTHFWIEAKGKENGTKTVIHLEDGDSLQYLNTKLGEKESFEVDTPASTMAVRGTVFRTYAYLEGGYKYTRLDVLQGKVEVSLHTTSGANNGVVKTFEAGQSAIMRADDSMSEFIYEGEIDYPSIPKEMAYHIGSVIEKGEILSISEDLLYDYVKINDHDWQEQVIQEATCTEDGKAKKVCSVCKEEQEEYVVKAYNHSDKEWVVKVEPTCLKTGEREEVCKLCGEVLNTETMDALGHSFSDWDTVVKPTCVKTGTQERICSVCKEKETKTIAALGHKYGDYVIDKQPTCTGTGSKTRVCSVCKEKDTVLIPAKGHDMSGWITDSYPDCGHNGSEHRECLVCGEIETNSTPAGGSHSWSCDHSGTWFQSPINSYKYVTATCGNCGATESSMVYMNSNCPYCGSVIQ